MHIHRKTNPRNIILPIKKRMLSRKSSNPPKENTLRPITLAPRVQIHSTLLIPDTDEKFEVTRKSDIGTRIIFQKTMSIGLV